MPRPAPAEHLVEQRRVIDEWRRDSNDVRPHEALGDVPPALVYQRTSRNYPRKWLKPDPPSWRELERPGEPAYPRKLLEPDPPS